MKQYTVVSSTFIPQQHSISITYLNFEKKYHKIYYIIPFYQYPFYHGKMRRANLEFPCFSQKIFLFLILYQYFLVNTPQFAISYLKLILFELS